jgi:hypothetical protein
MTCTEVEALIHKELDGELLDAEARSLPEHLAGCPRCAGLRDGLQQVLATARLACSPAAGARVPALRAPEAGAGRDSPRPGETGPATCPDLVGSVTRSLRRRRQLRLALVGSLAVAAGLLLFLLSTWPSTPRAKPVLPGRAPDLVSGARLPASPAPGQEASSPADFVSPSLNEGLVWVQEAWQRTQEEARGLVAPADGRAPSPAEEGASGGSWWGEVTATGGTLRDITREVGKRILPAELPPLYDTSQEEEKV